MRKILMPMDGSPHSQRALEWYTRNFNLPDDELIFAFVAEPQGHSAAGDVTTKDKANEGLSETIAKARAMATEAAKKSQELGVRAHIRFLERLSHNKGHAIVELANEEAVDIILIGNRGISGMKRAILGSVSDYILHHSHRTTIIVPPPKE